MTARATVKRPQETRKQGSARSVREFVRRRVRLLMPLLVPLLVPPPMALTALFGPGVAAADDGWRTLPEMVEPRGVLVDEAAVRQALTATPEGREGMARVEAMVTEDWRKLQAIDWHALSRYQLEATAGWRLPDAPGVLVSRVLGRDDRGRLHVEVRGPRLPARFDIVYRYLYVFATYDPLSGKVEDRLATIRGWVEE